MYKRQARAIAGVANAPAGAKAPAAATLAATATWPDFSDGNLGPDSTDDNLGPDSTDDKLWPDWGCGYGCGGFEFCLSITFYFVIAK